MRAREFIINVPIKIRLGNDTEPEDQDKQEPELDTMVPPLQQHLELEKRSVGINNVFGDQADQFKKPY